MRSMRCITNRLRGNLRANWRRHPEDLGCKMFGVGINVKDICGLNLTNRKNYLVLVPNIEGEPLHHCREKLFLGHVRILLQFT